MIINNKKILSHEELYCNSLWSQARGLMFRKRSNLIMKFSNQRKISLHMWFVNFPIQVLVLNEKLKVVEINKHFKPWSLWKSNKQGKYIVELGESHCQVSLGDILEFK